jgi:hypothetical protein
MATFAKLLLSGSPQGRQIKVGATASQGTTIHATGTSASVIDEVYIYAHNSATSAVVLTIQFGGTSSPDDNIALTLPARSGLTLVVPGLPLTGTGSVASTVCAFASTANVVMISGYIDRIA